MNENKTILVVDDEASHVESLTRIFEKEGYRVLGARTGEEALAQLRQQTVHVVLTDMVMPGMSGEELLRASKAIAPQTEVIMMTAYGTIESAVDSMKEGAYDFVTKPLKRVLITKVVRRALEKQTLLIENRTLRSQLETLRPQDIIGQSPAIARTLKIIRQAGPSQASVLITGESGTGKELLARAIHRASNRADKPFIAINCGALPDTILESELFGYEKGAFTGADRRHEGHIEAAHLGTLLLDEVGEMSAPMQVRLLRVLQEGELTRLGSHKTTKVDLRVVAATNQDLEAAVAQGRFREDLFWRLNVINVHVPPLRDRAGDVALLASFFLTRYACKNDKTIDGITGRALDALNAYAWPGNVRELENVIERAVVLSLDAVIDLDDLPDKLTLQSFGGSEKAVAQRGLYFQVGTTLEEAEMALILETLKATNNDKNLAARILGVATRTIYRKLDSPNRDAEPMDPVEDEAKES